MAENLNKLEFSKLYQLLGKLSDRFDAKVFEPKELNRDILHADEDITKDFVDFNQLIEELDKSIKSGDNEKILEKILYLRVCAMGIGTEFYNLQESIDKIIPKMD